MAVIHIPQEEALRDFENLLARVARGEVIIIDGAAVSVRLMDTSNPESLRAWLHALPESLRSIVRSEVARWSQAKANYNTLRMGRPKVLRSCPKCNAVMGARELWKHRC